MTATTAPDRAGAVEATEIPGLLVVRLGVHGDRRGWFKENWQRAKMVAEGFPDFEPVQNNVSFNTQTGVTRGVHAEPWDKYVTVASGRVFGAWVDLRPGETFGRCVTLELGPDRGVFVPRGVGNAFQTLEDSTAYSYLVNDHWSAAARASYTFLNLADETVAIDWPIPLERAELSEADRHHPRLADVRPMPPRPVLVTGAGGQLGRALVEALPGAVAVGRDRLDLADPVSVAAFDFSSFGTIVNAAAYTQVDAAETSEGRRQAWATNVTGVAALVDAARRHRARLVHVSSDYVFDGTRRLHPEDEPFSPLGVYGQTKAAGDALVATLPRHHLLRTSWVVGEGRNFVTTMAGLADRGVSPSVVDDQHGRLTFTGELVRALVHLLATDAPTGTYNVSNAGPTRTWADIAREVFALRGRDPGDVTPVSTEAYGAGKQLAPRPRHSTLDLSRLEATGFVPEDAAEALRRYLTG
ncbi:sugar nucleotide-binding protein [Microlunatus flavus]|uniref:dTDP-4-dehydrorhamnose reductase n=1 Tax=Microlunatus flavus TaxID=1036181 RepID=A0A1H9NJC6_9ACTN|nr:bifunctional dTDP-4-dehydrorhamnose 3,5-epimerase family protein/NAD(P)-dependent oxidoreductase [Microlunatus flavus]SER36002.1 dTDP-4-dehydrorhamnose 3,5-epimerase [Microlunatus flavus]